MTAKETLTDTIAELDRTFVRDSDAEGDWSVQPSERYELGAIVGSGAQGDVLRATDRVLGREVALKALRQDGIELDIGNFIREARLMAQIGHPNIMPIYDAGLLPDGRLFYTMPLLEQRTLAEVLVQIAGGDDMPLVRRMRLFANACTAVHEAHLKGVFHRDLKPHNMVIGPSGELLVTDFGLARREDEPIDPDDETGPIGTPLYMSPEQARGEPGDVASDVYSLGAILFELLTLRRPIEKENVVQQLVAVLQDTPPLAHELVPTVPLDLSDLANRCLAKEPSERPPSALSLVEGIEGWLEGRFEEERRREECRVRVEHARERLGVAQRLGTAIGALEAQLASMREGTPEHAPLAVKQPLWEIEGNIERLVLERDEAEEAAVTSLELALRARPNDAAASGAWVDVQLRRRQRLLDAGHVVLARRAAARAIRVGGDVLEHQLYGAGRLWVQTDHPVWLQRYEVRGGVLQPSDSVRVQPQMDVPPGSYRLSATAAGVEVYLPVLVEAGETVAVGFHPGLQSGLPAGFALVHAGPARLGGDRDAVHSEPMREVELHGFGMSRRPVTAGEYLAWLQTLSDPAAALLRGPRATPEKGPYWKLVDGQVVIPEEDGDGDAWHPDFPVFGITRGDAEAYIEWRSRRDGRHYRLPTDDEWERAARGADGRRHPWGDRFDPALCKMRLSRPGQFRPEPVGAFPTDVSPFGILDMGGSIAEWTSSAYRSDPQHASVRGGAWSSRAHRCAASFRGSMNVDHLAADLGFRLVVDL